MKESDNNAVREALGDFLGLLQYKALHGDLTHDDVRIMFSAIEEAGGVKASVRDWTVDFLFVDGKNDPEGIEACLYSFGATRTIVRDTRDLMDGGLNRGFTFSNTEKRVALSWIGPQADGSEWVNTTVHEIVHVAQAIAQEKEIDPFSEDFAYVAGDITQGVADILCRLACDRCRDGV